MRLVGMKVTNFRCYRDETVVKLDNLVVFVGKNDSGKSTLFDALAIFFDEKAVPETQDVCVYGDEGKKIRIACVFTDLPSSLVLDAQHPTSLTDEYLLNQDGHLEIVKTYDCSLAKPKCSAIYARAVHPTAESYSDLLTLTNANLKARAKELGLDLANVKQTVNTDLRRAIWASATDLVLEETEVELKAEAAKAIWDQLKLHMPVFALFKSDRPSTDQDAEAQDPMKAAVSEAIKTQEEVLEQIAVRVRDEVQEIADRTVEKIAEMDPELARQLKPQILTKRWDTLFSVSLTGEDGIPINKRGSGTRRLILLNFFRAQAEKEGEDRSAGVIYAVEEPETSQHPHNQLLLVKALKELSEHPGCQVFLTTHTPMLARRFDPAHLRLIAEDRAGPVIRDGRDENTVTEIVNSLGVLPDHNIRAFFGVEGRNDINFLRAISRTLSLAGEDVLDLGRAEDEGHLVFIPLGGSCLDLWVSRLRGFNRPEFYLFDRDNPPPSEPRYQCQANEINRRLHCRAWHTERKELENYISRDVIVTDYPNYAGCGDPFEDVPLLFAQAVHEAEANAQPWDEVCAEKDKLEKKLARAKRRLCSEFAAKMTPDLLTRVDPGGEVRGWIREVSQALDRQSGSEAASL